MAVDNDYSNNHLHELGGSDFEIADGQPNIKGWNVKDENGNKIGEVDELLFDSQSNKVRYIIVDLEGNVFDLETKDVLVPIGIAQLHEDDDDVILPGVTADQIRSLPAYKKDQVGPEVENQVRNAFMGLGVTGLAGSAISSEPATTESDTFYDHNHFSEDSLYKNRNRVNDASTKIPIIQEDLEVGKREVESGGIRLRSRIVEKNVSEDVNLRQEKVVVERTPVDKPANLSDIGAQEIVMSETKEVPIVSKEARVVEEISLNKEVSEHQETVRDTVRSTEVEIEDINKNESNVNRTGI